MFGAPATHLLQYTPAAGGNAVHRVNAGGPGYTDSSGNAWSADAFFIMLVLMAGFGPLIWRLLV